MNLNIRSGTVRYNNKILVSHGKFSLRKNDKVNALLSTPTITQAHKPTISQAHKPTVTHEKISHKPTITHEDEKAALVLFLTSGFVIWVHFSIKKDKTVSGCSVSHFATWDVNLAS